MGRRSGSSSRGGRWRRLWRATGGNAAVEFALVTPAFLAILLGTLVYGLYFGVAHSVQQLASEAARASVAGLTDVERGHLARLYVSHAVSSYSLLKPASLQVVTATDPTDSDVFKVTLSYDASGLGLNLFQRVLPSPTSQVQRTASIRRGGV